MGCIISLVAFIEVVVGLLIVGGMTNQHHTAGDYIVVIGIIFVVDIIRRYLFRALIDARLRTLEARFGAVLPGGLDGAKLGKFAGNEVSGGDPVLGAAGAFVGAVLGEAIAEHSKKSMSPQQAAIYDEARRLRGAKPKYVNALYILFIFGLVAWQC